MLDVPLSFPQIQEMLDVPLSFPWMSPYLFPRSSAASSTPEGGKRRPANGGFCSSADVGPTAAAVGSEGVCRRAEVGPNGSVNDNDIQNDAPEYRKLSSTLVSRLTIENASESEIDHCSKFCDEFVSTIGSSASEGTQFTAYPFVHAHSRNWRNAEYPLVRNRIWMTIVCGSAFVSRSGGSMRPFNKVADRRASRTR